MSIPWDDWFHTTCNTFGTWLRGDPRGWRERHHRTHVEGDYNDMKKRLLILVIVLLPSIALAGPMGRPNLDDFKDPIYTVEDGVFIRHNGDRYCNRPLYLNQTSGAVLAGDLPYLIMGGGTVRSSIFMLGLARGGQLLWAQHSNDITMRYSPGQMDWIVKEGTTVMTVTAVPTADGIGMAVRAKIDGALPGDQIIWLSGAAVREKETFLNHYDLTTGGRESRLKQGFSPQDCSGNKIAIDGDEWTVEPPAGRSRAQAKGRCSASGAVRSVDASDWEDAGKLNQNAGKLPICFGIVPMQSEVFWSIRATVNDNPPVEPNPKADFDAGLARAKSIQSRVVIDTPDAWLNAAVPASVHVMDGVFRDGMYTHAGMRWGVPLLGWRTTFGGTVYGWHDRVMTEAKKCIARQITESDKTDPEADPAAQLSSQSASSRMFGVGRIDLYQPHHYDMQSQFFDQLLYAWRSTGDAEMEKLLRPSLDLHLDYLKDCFDPSGMGIYESYANTWPTDDQWYNGGGTSEETAYAYRGHHDALLMAQRAGDDAKIKFHQAAMDQIRKGFFDLLWNKQQGHPGAYREQGGLKRLHDSAWLYAIFCPIDAGLLDTFQSAEALDYTEWGLERMKMPYGGEQCWPSNWVPSIWSVREMWPGDNYHLALAYYQIGLGSQGWELLKGTFPQQMFFGPVPGDLGHPAGGTDFNDCAGPFCRTVVEGLFGYTPDYPNHTVKFSPQFPAEWDHASIATPDMSIHYWHKKNERDFYVTVSHPADLDLRIPVSTTGVVRAAIDGKPAKFDVLPGFGQSVVKVIVPNATAAKLVVVLQDEPGEFPPQHLNVNTGEPVTLSADKGAITEVQDPQSALSDVNIVNGTITAKPTSNAGDHLVFGLVKVGSTTQYRQFKLHITDAAAEAAEEASHVKQIPKDAKWNTIDMHAVFNGDIRTIYQQKYISPRPNTCSLRLASDGYSTWQMVLDKKNAPPVIDLSKIDALQDSQKRIVSSDGVPFAWVVGEKNIAFTSQWDNWPKQIELPVNQTGEAIWFLVCGTTNPMEVQIANASLTVRYADGVTEVIDIVPPFNFWSLAPLQKDDYDYKKDFFALPKVPPSQIQLGNNCRAIVLNHRLRPGVKVDSVLLEALSQQSVIGLMGVTVMGR